MWYTTRYENTHFYPIFDRGRTAPDPGRTAFVRCLCDAPLPDLESIGTRRTSPSDAHQLGCDDQTVRNVIHEFNTAALTVLQQGSSRPPPLRTSLSQRG